MKRNCKKPLALAVCIALMMTLTAFASAAVTIRTVTATLDPTITIKYNGQVKTFTDINGTPVDPMVHEGTVYLPIRGVSGLLKLPVEWDGDTRTVLLGERDAIVVDETIWHTDADYFCSTQYSKDPTELAVDGQLYDQGLICRRFDSAAKGGKAGTFKLDKKYTSLNLKAVCGEGLSGTLKFYEDDVVYKSVELARSETNNVHIDVSGVQELTLSWEGNEKGATATIVDMTLR